MLLPVFDDKVFWEYIVKCILSTIMSHIEDKQSARSQHLFCEVGILEYGIVKAT